MWSNKWVRTLAFAAMLLVGAMACNGSELLIALATVTPTRTPRPTFTPVPTATVIPTVAPTITATPVPTRTATRRPPTARPRTNTPKPPPQPTAPPQPTVSAMEFHVNVLPCTHSGLTFIKGTVYLDKNDPSQRYNQAIVALGPPDGSTIYERVLSDGNGEYTFVLSEPGQGRVGNWAVWLVYPDSKRKSDIGGPINTNGLPAGDPKACWAGGVDFWK